MPVVVVYTVSDSLAYRGSSRRGVFGRCRSWVGREQAMADTGRLELKFVDVDGAPLTPNEQLPATM